MKLERIAYQKDQVGDLQMEQEYIIQSVFFPNKEKFVKGSKSRERRTQAVTLNADQTLRECATQKRDEKLLAVTSRVVAAEA